MSVPSTSDPLDLACSVMGSTQIHDNIQEILPTILSMTIAVKIDIQQ